MRISCMYMEIMEWNVISKLMYIILNSLCLMMVCLSLQWISKAPGEENALRNAINLKHRVRISLDKFDRLKIIYKTKREDLKAERCSGETEGAAVSKPQLIHPPEWTIHSQSHVSMFDAELDPTTPQAQIAKLQKKVSLKR